MMKRINFVRRISGGATGDGTIWFLPVFTAGNIVVVVLWKLISGRRKIVAAVRLRSDPQHVVFGATERLYGEEF